MIKFEYNMLVLNNAFSREDVEQINDFADYVRQQERDRIIALLTTELFAMRQSRSFPDWEQSYGVEIAIGLIDGGHE